jgi:hypothetical protein
MWYSSHNSNQFLSWYNKIDKFLSHVLDLKRYVPYGEKIDLIIQKNGEWSHVLDQYQSNFLYFWELRNQLVHGFSLDQKHFLEVSEYAVQQIERLYLWLTTPKTVGEVFVGEVYTCTTTDSLFDVIVCMKNNLNTHVPVYHDWVFIEMLSESTIAYRLADQIALWVSYDPQWVRVWDVSLENTNDIFVFISKSESVYNSKHRFLKHSANKKRLWALFITEDWNQNQPIIWIVTAMDLNRIMQSGTLLE